MAGTTPKAFYVSSHLILTKPYDKHTTNTLILLMRKPNIRDIAWLPQDGHKLVSGEANISAQVYLISKLLWYCSIWDQRKGMPRLKSVFCALGAQPVGGLFANSVWWEEKYPWKAFSTKVSGMVWTLWCSQGILASRTSKLASRAILIIVWSH